MIRKDSDTVTKCPVCNDEYINKREFERKPGKHSRESMGSIKVRSDYTVCRETTTELKGGHGNWKEVIVKTVYIHEG